MHEGKSEYPDDLLEIAEQTWVAAFKSHDETDETDPISVVYAALLAERQRCANVAEAVYEKRFDNRDEYPASRVHDFVVVARSIQRGILEPAPPSSTEES